MDGIRLSSSHPRLADHRMQLSHSSHCRQGIFFFFLSSSFTCLRPRPAWHFSHHQTRVCGNVACDGAGGGVGVDGDGDDGGGGHGGRSLKWKRSLFPAVFRYCCYCYSYHYHHCYY